MDRGARSAHRKAPPPCAQAVFRAGSSDSARSGRRACASASFFAYNARMNGLKHRSARKGKAVGSPVRAFGPRLSPGLLRATSPLAGVHGPIPTALPWLAVSRTAVAARTAPEPAAVGRPARNQKSTLIPLAQEHKLENP